MERPRIVVVDDDPCTVKILAFVLSDAGYQAEVARSGAEARTLIVGRETALALLDVQLPDTDGVTLLADLRARRYSGPVVFLSGQTGINAKLAAFRQGADDYLAKPFEPLELLARVEAVIRRYRAGDRQSLGAIIRVDDAELNVETLTYTSATVAPAFLAPTEMRILECLMRNAHIIISRDTLIERVWGFAFYGNTNRVDVYIRRVRRRIEPDPTQPRYLQTARGLGYVFRPGATPDGSEPPAAIGAGEPSVAGLASEERRQAD